jgi:hypothetical protein
VFVTKEAVGSRVANQERDFGTFRRGSNWVIGCDQYLVSDDSAWFERMLLEVADERQFGADTDGDALRLICRSQHATEAQSDARTC